MSDKNDPKAPPPPATPKLSPAERRYQMILRQSQKIHDDTWEYCVHMMEHRNTSPEAAFNGIALVMRHMLINLRSTGAISPAVQDVVGRMANDFYVLAFERFASTAVEQVRRPDRDDIERGLPSNLKVM